jgi:hypothetical protein
LWPDGPWRFKSSPAHCTRPGERWADVFSDRAGRNAPTVNRFGHAGLIGWRAKAGRTAAEWLGRRTPLDAETLTTLVGLYLFVSRTRRMAQMLSRLRDV